MLHQVGHKGSSSGNLSSGKPLKALHGAKLNPDTAAKSPPPVYFYNRDDPFYEFTNFYPKKIVLDGKTWPTTEHYFQAQKFVGTPYFDYIRDLPRPRDAFELCRNPVASKWVRADWHQVKDDVMLKALMTKFSQHEDLKRQLLGTGKRRLVEHTWNDSYWGDGGDGKGRNRLGELLMQVRDSLGTAKTGDAEKHPADSWKWLNRFSSKKAKDDNSNVEERSASRQYQGHSHLASPLTSRRLRSRSVGPERMAKTATAEKDPAATREWPNSLGSKKANDDNYGVEEHSAGRQYQRHTHLASPLLSRRSRSRSMDPGRASTPVTFNSPMVAGVTASNLGSDRTFGQHRYHYSSSCSPTNSHPWTLPASKSSYDRPIETTRPVHSVSPMIQPSSLPTYIPKHSNQSSVSYNILHHHS